MVERRKTTRVVTKTEVRTEVRRSSASSPSKERNPESSKVPVRTLLLLSLFSFGISYAVKYGNNDQECSEKAQRYFVSDYNKARENFLYAAASASAEITSIPLSDGSDLFIDFAVIKGKKDEALIHLSGTHGVEGYAGSAVQTAVLADYRDRKEKKKTKGQPTVILVHAVNPYGMKYYRRTNENNVDLNRNFLEPETFEKVKGRNTSVYEELSELVNPSFIPSATSARYMVKSLMKLLKYGLSGIKKAVIEGQYKYPEGLFYGGTQLQPSLRILQDFLTTRLDLSKMKKVIMIDVHTGLGPAGVDTLIIEDNHLDYWRQILTGTNTSEAQFETLASSHSSTLSGAYVDSVGSMMDGMRSLFPSAVHLYGLTQEFGTKMGPVVLYNLVRENAAAHHQPDKREEVSKGLLDAFYLDACFWKNSIMHRGQVLFWAALDTMGDF